MGKKAWLVYDPDGYCDDWTTDIVFAETRGKALFGSPLHQEGDVPFQGLRVTRKPEWDQYAERGRVPDQRLIEDGWWLECNGCYRQLYGGMVEDNNGDEHPVVFDRIGFAYCTAACRDKTLAEDRFSNANDDPETRR